MYKLCQMFFNDVGSSHLNSVEVQYVGAGAKDSTCDHKTVTELVINQSSRDLRLLFNILSPPILGADLPSETFFPRPPHICFYATKQGGSHCAFITHYPRYKYMIIL